jgi:hypothetical protein
MSDGHGLLFSFFAVLKKYAIYIFLMEPGRIFKVNRVAIFGNYAGSRYHI